MRTVRRPFSSILIAALLLVMLPHSPAASSPLPDSAILVTVPPSLSSPTVDGSCLNAEYSDGNSATFNFGSGTAVVKVKHTTDYLYICFTNLPYSGGEAVVLVDSNNDRGSRDSSDFRLRAASSAAPLGLYYNPATGQFNGAAVSDFTAAWGTDGEFQSYAEFRIGRRTMGGWQRGAVVSLRYNGTVGVESSSGWPNLSSAYNPDTWGVAWLLTADLPVPTSASIPTLNGICTAGEYIAGTSITFNIGGRVVLAEMKQSTNYLFVCLSNLAIPVGGMQTGPNAVVYLDTGGLPGGDVPDSDSIALSISYTGVVSAHRGGRANYNGPTPGGYAIQRSLDTPNSRWSAEFRMDRSLVGNPGRSIGLAVAQQWVNGVGDDYGWPVAYNWAIPNTWASTLLSFGGSSSFDIFPATTVGTRQIEVTQAIQDMNNSVVLIAGKRTFARVYVQATSPASGVSARLYGYRNGISLGMPLHPINPGGTINILNRGPTRVLFSDTLNFELPSSWIQAGTIELVAVVNPENSPIENNLGNNSISSGPLTFLETKPLRLHMRDIRYTTLAGAFVQSRSLDFDLLESQLRRMYPISRLYTTQRAIVITGTDNELVHYPFDLTIEFANPKLAPVAYAANWVNEVIKHQPEYSSPLNSSWIFYGMVFDSGGFMRGEADGIPSRVASGPAGSNNLGWDFDGSYGDWYGAHEIGHVLDQHHADFCGAGSAPLIEPDYPYAGGWIGDGWRYVGFDAGHPGLGVAMRPIPSNWTDVMTYCDNEWISDYTYTRIRNYIQSNGAFTALDAPPPAVDILAPLAVDTLTVAGQIQTAVQAAAVTYAARETIAALPPAPPAGDYHLRLLNIAGGVLSDTSFKPVTNTENREMAAFDLTIPYIAGARKISIYSDLTQTEIGSRAISLNAPTVTGLTHSGGANWPASGPIQVNWTGTDANNNSLRYTILYSFDNRATWRLVGFSGDQNSIEFDASQFEGTKGALGYLRVVANDGVLTGFAETGPFTVPNKPPKVLISNPADGSSYVFGQTVALEGSTQDFEDGTLPDAFLSWSSNVDGPLGTGSLLHADLLSPGTHTITLTAQDLRGVFGAASVIIHIDASAGPRPAQLAINPTPLLFTMDFAGNWPGPQPLFIRNLGDGSIDWTVTSDKPWVVIPTGSGKGDTDLDITIDPSSLPVGNHTAVLTISSTGGTQTLAVNLTIIGKVIYLPMLRR